MGRSHWQHAGAHGHLQYYSGRSARRLKQMYTATISPGNKLDPPLTELFRQENLKADKYERPCGAISQLRSSENAGGVKSGVILADEQKPQGIKKSSHR